MVKGLKYGAMEQVTQATIRVGRSTGMECISGLMGQCMKGTGMKTR